MHNFRGYKSLVLNEKVENKWEGQAGQKSSVNRTHSHVQCGLNVTVDIDLVDERR